MEKKFVDLDIDLPQETIDFYQEVADNAGVTLSEAIAVVLVMHLKTHK